jgi:CIC family chloride channel protein
VHPGILEAATRHRADLLVMGWKGYTNTRDRIFGEVADQVIRHAPCDLMLLKIAPEHRFERVLFPTSGGPNARLATEFLGQLATAHGMSVTASYVIPPGSTLGEKIQGLEWIDRTLEGFPTDVQVEKELIEAQSVAGGIALESRGYDLVVLGAAKEPLLQTALFGEIPTKVARFSPTSVLVVKRYEGKVRSFLKKAMG